jgi:hypothetical protein
MNTYGSLDFYVRLLNENNLSPGDVPNSSLTVIWDESLVTDQTIQQLTTKNKIKFATLMGFGTPEQIKPIMSTYKDPISTSYTGTNPAGESVITIAELQGNEVVQIEKEIRPLKASEFIFDSTTGVIQLVGGLKLEQDETLFVIYKKTITV